MPGPNDKAHRDDAGKKQAPTDDYHDQTDERGPDPQRDQEAALKAAHIPLAHDRPAEVLRVSVHGKNTQIAIGAGQKHGVTVGMQGYVNGPNGALADFTITRCEDRLAWAEVELTPDQISRAGAKVVLNPAHSPVKKLAPGTHGSILRVQVEGGRTRIWFSRGYMQGVTWQMAGNVIDKHGRPLDSFKIADLGPNDGQAVVELTPDQLRDADVVLNP